MNVRERAPDQSRRLRVKGEFVAGVAPGSASFQVPPLPGLSPVHRAGEADVRVTDVVTLRVKRIGVVVPGRGHHQSITLPLVKSRPSMGIAPHFAAVRGQVGTSAIYPKEAFGVVGSDSDVR